RRSALLLLLLALRAPAEDEPKVRRVKGNGPPEKSIDVLFVAEGYTKRKAGKFAKDVERYSSRLLGEPPFSWYRDRFNISSVFVASEDEGCDLSPTAEKVSTLLQSHFDAPDGRLLVFKDRERLAKLVRAAGAVDIVFVLVDTEKYGGAGTVLAEVEVRGRPLPAPTCSAQDTRSFLIAIHELGHSLADLADEYTDPQCEPIYPIPGEGDLSSPNVTLPRCFDGSSYKALAGSVKWKHFLELRGAERHVWVHEGGHYRDRGVFRPWPTCMMREHGQPYCPVCAEEVAKALSAACGEAWDDAAFHRAHPLSEWK
ncbi:MAG: M64 family metallopeptidase, partial [Planctomycetota bacterium]